MQFTIKKKHVFRSSLKLEMYPNAAKKRYRIQYYSSEGTNISSDLRNYFQSPLRGGSNLLSEQ